MHVLPNDLYTFLDTTLREFVSTSRHFVLSDRFLHSHNIDVWMNVNIWNIYFELRMKDQIEERSSQLLRNLSSCEE